MKEINLFPLTMLHWMFDWGSQYSFVMSRSDTWTRKYHSYRPLLILTQVKLCKTTNQSMKTLDTTTTSPSHLYSSESENMAWTGSHRYKHAAGCSSICMMTGDRLHRRYLHWVTLWMMESSKTIVHNFHANFCCKARYSCWRSMLWW